MKGMYVGECSTFCVGGGGLETYDVLSLIGAVILANVYGHEGSSRYWCQCIIPENTSCSSRWK